MCDLDFEASLDSSEIMASEGDYPVTNGSFCRNIFFLISYVRIISWNYAQLSNTDTINAAALTKSTNRSVVRNAAPTLFHLITSVMRSVSHNWLLAYHVQLSKWAPWSLAQSHNSQLTDDLIKAATSRMHAAQSFFPCCSSCCLVLHTYFYQAFESCEVHCSLFITGTQLIDSKYLEMPLVNQYM